MEVHIKHHKDTRPGADIMQVTEYVEKALSRVYFKDLGAIGAIARLVETLTEKGILDADDIGRIVDERFADLELARRARK